MKIEQTCPVFRKFLENRGIANFARRDFKAAQPYLERMLSLYPSNTGYALTLGTTLREMGELKRSLALYREFVPQMSKYHPRRNLALYDYAVALLRNREHRQALEVADNITTRDPYHAKIKLEVYEMVVSRCRESGDRKLGIDALCAAIAVAPTSTVNLWNLGAMLCQEGRLREGISMYRRALEQGDNTLSAERRAQLLRDLRIGERALESEFKDSTPTTTSTVESSGRHSSASSRSSSSSSSTFRFPHSATEPWNAVDSLSDDDNATDDEIAAAAANMRSVGGENDVDESTEIDSPRHTEQRREARENRSENDNFGSRIN